MVPRLLQTTLIFLLLGLHSIGQVNQWSLYTPFPEGGRIVDLCTDNNNTVYALTSHSSMIFYSTNAGQTWNRVPNTQSYWNATCIKYNNATGTLFVGTLSSGVRWTSNLGQSWNFQLFYTNTSSGQSAYIATIGIDQTSGTIICFEPSFGSSKFYRSQSNGSSWTTLNNPSFGSALDLKYFSDGNLYAATANGVFKSTDNAATWLAINNGITSLEITSVEEKGSGSYYFAGVDFNLAAQDSSNTGVFVSSNGGLTWAPSNSGLDCKIVKDIEVGSNGNIYAATIRGIFESSNNGQSWTQIDNGLLNKNIWKLTKDGNDNLFCGSLKCGVAAAATNGGINWSYRNEGLKWNTVQDLHMDPDGKIFVTDAGLAGNYYKTNASVPYMISDSGQVFTPVVTSSIGFTSDASSGLRIMRAPGGSLFASFRNKTEMIFRSDDDGLSWVNTTNNISLPANTYYGSVDFIVFDTLGNTYIAINYSTSSLVRNEIFKSSNNGNSWSSIYQGGFSTNTLSIIDLNVTKAGTLYVTTSTFSSNPNEIKSYNPSTGWTQMSTTGLPTPPGTLQLFIDRNNNLWLKKSNNSLYAWQGGSWTQVTIPWQTGGRLFFDNLNNIYASETNNGVYFSDNGGASWSNISTGVPMVFNGSAMVPLTLTDFYFDQNNVAFARSSITGSFDSLNFAGIYTYNNQIPLSVSLLQLYASESDDQGIRLRWTAENEKNIDKYSVQRSVDGFANYQVVAEVSAKNNSQPLNEYVFADHSFDPGPDKAYRLKAKGLNGSYSYSNAVIVRGTHNRSMEIYPNPVPANTLFVRLRDVFAQKKIVISIFDESGTLKKEVTSFSGDNSGIQVDLSALNPGYYLLKCTDMETGTKWSHTFVKKQ